MIKLPRIDIISMIIIILVTHFFFFKKCFDIGSKDEKLTEKKQSLERPTNEPRKLFT